MTINNVFFINTPVPELNDCKLEPNMGLLYLSSYVKRELSISTKYIEFSELSEVSSMIGEKQNCVFCFSCYTSSYNMSLLYSRAIRDIATDSVFIAGGPHATALPQEVVRDFDFVVTGEGEYALVSILKHLMKDTKIENNIIAGRAIKNLDSIPIPDFESIDMSYYSRIVDGKKSISILTSRGCPYKCNFCNSIVMGGGANVRFRSVENIVAEVEHLIDKFNIRSFRIQDDIFGIRPEIRKGLADRFQSMNLTFRCFSRADVINSQLLDDFTRMGISHISFGLESGSQKILDAMNKGLNVDQIKKAIKLTKSYGIATRAFFIVGYPGETWETLRETESLINHICVDEISIYPLIPYPGTDLFHNPSKYNIQSIDRDFNKYFQVYGDKKSGYVFETDTLSRSDISEMREYLIRSSMRVSDWAGESAKNR